MIAHYNPATKEESRGLQIAIQPVVREKETRRVVVRCSRLRCSPRQRAKSLKLGALS